MSVATHGDSVLATRLARLVSHATALKASGLIDDAAAAQVVRLAKATKAFCESLDWTLARQCLARLNEVSAEIAQDKEIVEVSTALSKHTKSVRDRLRLFSPETASSSEAAA